MNINEFKQKLRNEMDKSLSDNDILFCSKVENLLEQINDKKEVE